MYDSLQNAHWFGYYEIHIIFDYYYQFLTFAKNAICVENVIRRQNHGALSSINFFPFLEKLYYLQKAPATHVWELWKFPLLTNVEKNL